MTLLGLLAQGTHFSAGELLDFTRADLVFWFEALEKATKYAKERSEEDADADQPPPRGPARSSRPPRGRGRRGRRR